MAYTPKSLLGPLPPDSGPTPKRFLHADTTHELYNPPTQQKQATIQG